LFLLHFMIFVADVHPFFTINFIRNEVFNKYKVSLSRSFISKHLKENDLSAYKAKLKPLISK